MPATARREAKAPMRTSTTGTDRSRGGFTLVELAVVTLLVALLAVAVAPSFASFWRASQVRNCAWQMAALARRARDYAVCHAVCVAVEYDDQERVFRLAAEGDPEDAPGEFESLALAGAPALQVPDAVAQVDVSVEGGAADEDWPILFFPDGQALQAEIVLEAAAGNAFSVEIAPLTGRARVLATDVRESE